MAWHKFATIKTDNIGIFTCSCEFYSATEQAIDWEIHSESETYDIGNLITSGTSAFYTDVNDFSPFISAETPNAEYDLWFDLDSQVYTELFILSFGIIGTIPSVNLSNSVLDVATINLSNIGLETLTGIDGLTNLENINISGNNMTAEQINAIVDDVYTYAINTGKNNGTLNITRNDAPDGDSLLKYNALVGFGWNAGTPITDISNRFELEAIGLLLNGNFNQIVNIDLDGAGAVWKDSGGTVVPSPVPDGSLDISGCNNWYDDAVIKGIFTGSFNGNGYKITNLAIKQQIDVERHCGLFEQVFHCQISNLTVSGNMQALGSSSSGYSGGLIGYIVGSLSTVDNCASNVNCLSGSRVGSFVGASVTNPTIINCYSTGDVTSSGVYAGGFVGNNNSSATITNCYSTGDVTSSGDHAGGFIGLNNSSATITNCYSTGNVASSGSYPGGFVGRNYSSSTITNCYSTGNVASSGSYPGGFAGYNGSSSTITDCYSTGNVASSGSYPGGFVGYNTSSTITNCYSTGDVASSGNDAGGFVGRNNSSTITTSFCYGEVTGTSGSKAGFAGRNTTSDILDCYYRSDYYAVNFPAIRVDETGTENTVRITGLTAAEFRNKANFTGFDFAEVWVMGIDYPELRGFFGAINPLYETGMNDLGKINNLYNRNDLYAYNRLYDE